MKQIELTPDLNLDAILRELADDDIVLTRSGHAVALLTEFDDDELYWYNRERSPEFIESMKRAREQVQRGEVISHEDLKRKFGLD